jgi:hypothetical protein
VEDVKLFCKNDVGRADVAYAYYYCDFGRSHDETPHLLRWALNQFCRQLGSIPPEIFDLHKQIEQPSISKLLDVLSTIIQHFTKVYLVIDAIDESSKRESILNCMVEISRDLRFERIQLLATSRKELDIKQSFEHKAKTVSLSNKYVGDDIRAYIWHRLSSDSGFSRWPYPIRCEIQFSLQIRAQGIYVINSLCKAFKFHKIATGFAGFIASLRF